MAVKVEHQDEEFTKKIGEIEKYRKAQIENIEQDLGGLTSKLSRLGWLLLCLWILLSWPVSLLFGVGTNILTFCLLLFLYFKVSPAIERKWQGEGESKSEKKRCYAQLMLAGSLTGTHRKLFSWSSEYLGARYEVHIGTQYERKGYQVEYRGLLYRQYDVGVDLTCSLGKDRLFVQCKYYSSERLVDEKVVLKLYNTIGDEQILKCNKGYNLKGIVVTSSNLTIEARSLASKCHIEYLEQQKF